MKDVEEILPTNNQGNTSTRKFKVIYSHIRETSVTSIKLLYLEVQKFKGMRN